MTPKYTYIYLQQTHIFLLHIFGWMTNNRLNANIRDYIIIGTSRHRKSTHFFPTPIHIRNITPSPTVRNLGFTFDSDFNFIKHISLACRCYFYHIRDLRRFVAILLFQLPNPLLQHALLVGLITATLFFVTLHLQIF